MESSQRSIKSLFKHSIIYGVGDILNRAGAILLLPLYTRYLMPTEYGKLEMFYVFTNVAILFVAGGLSHAALRFYYEYEDERERKNVISTAIIFSLFFSGLSVLIVSMFINPISMFIFEGEILKDCFYITFAVIVISILQEICYAYIRIKEYSLFFVAITIGELIIKVLLSSYLVIAWRWGVKGVLFGNFLSICFSCFIAMYVTLRECGLSLHFRLLRDMFNYSMPLVFVSFCGMVISSSDRFFLQRYGSLASVGLYALGMRFGSLVNYVFTQPFTKGFGPYRFSIMNDPNASQVYARIMTYYFTGAAFIGLGIMLFSEDVIRIMSSPDYFSAVEVIPLLILGTILGGVYYIVQTGIYIMKNTKYLSYVFAIVSIASIAANFLLIPQFGMIGAGVAFVITNFLVVLFAYRRSQSLFFIPYEKSRIILIVVAATAVYLLSLVPVEGGYKQVVYRIVLIILFPLIIWNMPFFSVEEKNSARSIATQMVKRFSTFKACK